MSWIIISNLCALLVAVTYALPPTTLFPNAVKRDSSTACPTGRPFYLSYNAHGEVKYAANFTYEIGARSDILSTFSTYNNANPSTYIFVENEGGCQLSTPPSNESGSKVFRSTVSDLNEKYSDVHYIRLSFRQFPNSSVKGEEVYCHTNAQLRLFCSVSRANYPVQNMLGFETYPNEEPANIGGELLIFGQVSKESSRLVQAKINIEFQDVA